MHNDRSEIFVNFFCGYMNRFKEHKDEQIPVQIKSMVGTDDLSEIIAAEDSIDAFCQAFRRKLTRLGPYTLRFMMRDETNVRDNAFFFCGRNAMGFQKIKGAMWKIDPVHGSSFSAYRQHPRAQTQSDMFEAGPYTYPLSVLIRDRYTGKKGVLVSEIFKWVIEETDSFLPSHARIELEFLVKSGVIERVIDPDQKARKRAARSWPDRLALDFAS